MCSGKIVVVAAGLVVFLMACGVDSKVENAGPCHPGMGQPCDCVGGGHGVQYCSGDATWGRCNCGITGADVLTPDDVKDPPDIRDTDDVPLVDGEIPPIYEDIPPVDEDIPPVGEDVPQDGDVSQDISCVPSVSQAFLDCGTDGDVYWFDDCGHEGALAQDCVEGEACVSGGNGDAFCANYCDVYACWSVEPSGQTQCFSNNAPVVCSSFPCETDGTPDFCGQDAQYADRDRTFSCRDKFNNPQESCDETADSGEMIVDSLTGLVWQRMWVSDQTWQEAVEYCDGLTYGGRDNWRLPSYEELAGLLDFGRQEPAINTTAFAGTPAHEFWTASPLVSDKGQAWAVSFWSVGVIPRNVHEDRSVRCVSDGGARDQAPSRFANSEEASDLVFDFATNLIWQATPFTAKKWSEALRYCEGLTLAGQGTWRLPNVNELRSLVDVTRSGPATVFPGMPELTFDEADRFWSSTAVVFHHDTQSSHLRAWAVDFVRGEVLADMKDHDHRGLCVMD